MVSTKNIRAQSDLHGILIKVVFIGVFVIQCSKKYTTNDSGCHIIKEGRTLGTEWYMIEMILLF